MRILIAEDEVTIARVLKVMLEKNKYAVDMVHNGSDALDYIQAVGYDALVLDIMMPGKDGIEVLKAARAEGNTTPTLFLTAKAEAMRQAGLTPDFSVTLPEQLPLSDLDLTALLGNALDNAMEAAVRAEDKTVSVRCRVQKGLFMLRVENTLGGAVAPDLATTKADKTAHGLGLPGMREIAERYGGTLEAGVKAGRFELVVCLPVQRA